MGIHHHAELERFVRVLAFGCLVICAVALVGVLALWL